MCWARPTGLRARESHTFVEEPGADTLAYSRLGLLQVYIEENSPGIPFPRWYHDPALLWQVVLVALAFVVFLAWDRAGIAHFAWGAVPALMIAIAAGLVPRWVANKRAKRWLTRTPRQQQSLWPFVRDVIAPIASIAGLLISAVAFL